MTVGVYDPRLSRYAITDQASAGGRTDASVVADLIEGGCTCLQYRAKKATARERWRTALALRGLTRDAGVMFIVNDRIDLALDCGADGVHLGQDDAPVEAARALARGAGREAFLVGLSTHSPEQARAAAAAGEGRPDYIGCGPVFDTRTKENNVPAIGIAALREVLASVDLPVVAIGGIRGDRLESVAAAGALHCAVVTALTGAPDVAAASRSVWGAWTRLTHPRGARA